MANKIGRNDPCPCGSGKKYKRCCGAAGENLVQGMMGFPAGNAGAESMESAFARYQAYVESGQADRDGHPSFMEFMGKPNAATAVTNRIHEMAADKNFASIDEAERFMQASAATLNDSPLPGFLGLSSAQMHRVMSSGSFAELSGIVRFTGTALHESAARAPLARVARFVLDRYLDSDGALPITQAGNFKPALVRQVLAEACDGGTIFNEHAKREEELTPLFLVHDFLAIGEYVAENTTTSRLTPAGLVLANGADSADLWKRLFIFMLYDADWLQLVRDGERLTRLNLVRDTALFSLLLLSRHAKGWTGIGDHYARFVRAFPDFDPQYGKTDEIEVGEIYYRIMFIDNFCENLALVEAKPVGDDVPFTARIPFRASPLLKNLLEWPSLKG